VKASNRVATIRFAGLEHSASVATGSLLIEAAREAGVEINATCGGRGRCRGCRVKLTEGIAPPPTLCDMVQLGAEEIREGYRLACQYRVVDDANVRISPPAAESAFQILTDTQACQGSNRLAPNSGVAKYHVPAAPPPGGAHGMSDLDALWQRTGLTGSPRIGLETLRRIPAALGSASDGITLTTIGDRIVSLDPGDTSHEVYGMAFDIGTTTVVGYLIDLVSGEPLATVSGLNPQTAYGGDLISRIAFAAEGTRNLRTLRTRIVTFVNELIGQACAESGLATRRIYKVVVVGNTCMHHLFLGIDPTSVGLAPYAPVIRHGYSCPARDAGLRVNAGAELCMLPLVAGFVGADTVAMVLATRLYAREQMCVAVDVGTNAEVVMGNHEKLIACSAPAGPALEGGQVRDGMRAALGAIDRVWIDGDVKLGTIGGVAPIGICGSGLIDAVAALLDAGIVAPSGRLAVDPAGPLPKALRSRIVEDDGGCAAVVLVRARDSATGKDIVLDQRDIRQLQLAKGAIRSGATALAQVAGVAEGDVAEFLLAGGFGNYLNLRSARRIGLIGDVAPTRVRNVANAAGLGAQLALLSAREVDRAAELAQRIEHVSLAEHPDFQRLYLASLAFPARSEGNRVVRGRQTRQ